MRYRTRIEVADTLRRLSDGSASADPLRASDRAELERIAGLVEEMREAVAYSREQLERVAVAAYSLGARHALERTQASVLSLESAYREKVEVLEQLLAVHEPARVSTVYDRERVNLQTGEITTVGEDGADHE